MNNNYSAFLLGFLLSFFGKEEFGWLGFWFGLFCVFEKQGKQIISYDRTVWR